MLLLYALSGAAGLVYEVLWLRVLTLSMGHTAGAVGILLAAFMGGLALGAWWGGRLAQGVSGVGALRAYAALEVAVGVAAALVPMVIGGASSVLARAYADGTGGLAFDAVRAMLALVLLTVPAAAMGATYPLAVRWRGAGGGGDAEGRAGESRRAGMLYAANTTGAAAGAAAAGFVLLPALGTSGTTAVGMVLNALAAGGAMWLAARAQTAGSAPARDAAQGPPARAERPRRPAKPDVVASGPVASHAEPSRLQPAILIAALSGAVGLVYQVTWTRILALVLGPTTYAFSAMLVAVIAGIAIGSAAASARVPASPARTSVRVGWVLVAAALAALGACLAVDRLPLVMAGLVTRADVTFGAVLAMQVLLVIAVQLPMTMALGAVFPLAIGMAAPSTERAPRLVSVLYAGNTVGAIAGALTASFVLVPHLGIQASIRLAACLAVAGGLAVAWQGMRRSMPMAAAAAITVVVAVVMPSWSYGRLTSGGYRYAATLAQADLETSLDVGQILYYREGAAGTVSVRQVPGARSLAIDGKVDASNAADMLTQKLLAHLPLLLHPAPRRVCVIGLGSGVTLAGALTHPVERVDVVEISPEVVEASAYFEDENRSPLADRRTRLVLGDGRTHLRLAREQYDVIISEPSNPWMAGIAALFTREFFEAARDRLAPGGLLTQWAHTYTISDDDLRSIVVTFLSVFPDGTAWLVGESDLLLVGGTAPMAALERDLEASWARPGVAADLALAGVRDPFGVLSLHVAGGDDLQRYASGAAIQTDDRLALEFTAPRAIYGRFQENNVDRLRAAGQRARQPPAVAAAMAGATASEWTGRGLMQLRAGAARLAYVDLLQAVAAAPGDVEALRGFVRAAAQTGRLPDAERVVAEAARAGSVPALVELSVVQAALGRVDDATESARRAVLANPRDPGALRQLASMYAEAGQQEGLERLIQVADEAGEPAAALYARLRLAHLREDFSGAAREGEELSRVTPGDADVWTLLGSSYAALGQYDRARQALESAQRLAPTDARVLVNLGTVALRSGDLAAARARFSEAVFLDPVLPAARDGLAATRAAARR